MTKPKPGARPHRKFNSAEERRAADFERKKKWRETNPEKAKASVKKFFAKHPHNKKNAHLQKKYGICLQDIYDIVELQGGCALCGAPDPRRKSRAGGAGEWCVDHNHATGAIRGIVCHPCNAALGMANDDPSLLRRMADYLERYK